ncbi:MAG: ATP-dependent Clp protease adaptor ClpS [Bacteroidota bacterium]|nr:ATP-dependent Clp protease adaptor ClpS [Bacteroidota bacterium]
MEKYLNIEQEVPNISQETDTAIGIESRVILYNDDWHTFDEVINQIIKAVKCSFETARDYTFQVHVKGKCIVFNGDLPSCLGVSSVLEEIQLNTQIIT